MTGRLIAFPALLGASLALALAVAVTACAGAVTPPTPTTKPAAPAEATKPAAVAPSKITPGPDWPKVASVGSASIGGT